MTFFSVVLTYICVLLRVAFFTLLERKVLRYIQIRKGPNKVGVMGVLQPIADAIKLFLKENFIPSGSNGIAFYLAPCLGLFLSLLLWHVLPRNSSPKFIKYGVLFFICVTAINVYSILIAGWSSNSKYAFLGALRAAAQTISYEVRIILILLFPIFLIGHMRFDECVQFEFWIILILIPVFFMWVCRAVAETNRAPFDFAEGESELVSGFNVEFGAAGFALIFIAEYANILVIRIVTSVFFLGGTNLFFFRARWVFTVKIVFLAFFYVWIRVAYPRFRYDLLMALAWKRFLPVILRRLALVIILLVNS